MKGTPEETNIGWGRGRGREEALDLESQNRWAATFLGIIVTSPASASTILVSIQLVLKNRPLLSKGLLLDQGEASPVHRSPVTTCLVQYCMFIMSGVHVWRGPFSKLFQSLEMPEDH